MKNFLIRIVIAIVMLAITGFSQPRLAAQPAAPAPPAWQWEKTRTPNALVVNGIWWEYFQVDQTLNAEGLRYSEDYTDLPRFSVIIFVNAALNDIPIAKLEEIREFVRQGGGVVFLGGFSAYGNSNYQNLQPIVDIMPVDLLKNNGYVTDTFVDAIPTAPKGARLAPAPNADWKMPYDFQAAPMAYYFHSLVPTNGAKVQVTVGDQPAFVTGTFGKGRVVACSLTVNGEPPAGQTPFWEWKDWQKLLGQAIQWAAGARPAGTTIVKPLNPTLKPLTEDELRSAEMTLDELPKELVNRAVANPTEKIARLLFDLAAPARGDPKCGLETVLPALLPYVKPEWVPRLKPLAEATNQSLESRKAALTLLGACHDPAAYDIFLKALDDEQLQLAAIDGLGRLGNEKAIPILKSKFDAVKPVPLSADHALMPFWWRSSNPAQLPDRYDPAAFAIAAQPAAYAALALYRLGDPEGVIRLCTIARNVSFYYWIFMNASNRVAHDPTGIAYIVYLQKTAAKLQELETYLENNVGPVPESQRAAFVKYALTVDDSMMIEFLVGAMEKSAGKMPKAEWQALSTAKSGIIAKTGQALASE